MPQLCGRRRQPSAPPLTFHRTCLNPSTDGALLAQTRFTQVLYIFANEWTRSELDRLCHEAQLAAKSSLPKKKSPAVCAQVWPCGELGGDYAYQSGYSFRMYRVIVLVFAAALLSSCSTKLNLGDYLPEWAGGTPKTASPPPTSTQGDAEAARDKSKDTPKPGDCSVGGCPQR
jgi:hypothetical protein